MSKYFTAEITGNRFLNKYFKLLGLRSDEGPMLPEPGQFYMLQAGNTCDPLLKRPFSIFKQEENSLQFLYRVRGKGTRSLALMKEGDTLQVLGPLGNSYPLPEGDFIAVAGGIGLASLLPLLARCPAKAHFFYGARNRDELVMAVEAELLAKDMVIATDDGSAGRNGLITGALSDYLSSHPGTSALPVYACGPAPMLKALHRVIAEKGMRCYVSLEEHMACGVGACLGCVVKTTSGYKRVCKEGPVFDMEDIVW